jgi:hypothetical protein
LNHPERLSSAAKRDPQLGRNPRLGLPRSIQEARMRLVLSAALAFVLLAPSAASSQTRPQQDKPQPARAYKPVEVKLPAPFNDASFEAFRKQLGETAQKQDRTALAGLVVAQGFFWETESGDKADKAKTGVDNLSAIIDLGGKDAAGWDLLTAYAGDPTAQLFPGRPDVVCAPADPAFDESALEELAKATRSDPGDWAFPLAEGVEVRASSNPKAPVIEKLGLHFVRILPDGNDAPPAANQIPLIRIATPSGKIGFVAADAIAPLGNDQICYMKDAAGWKIAGFVGAGEQ